MHGMKLGGATIALALLLACQTPVVTASGPPSALGRALAADASRLFAHYDTNADGRFSPAEAAALSLAGDAFKAADTDGDGAISQAEFLAPARLGRLEASFRGVAERLADAEDTDGDQRVSREEFLHGMLVAAPGPTVASAMPEIQEAAFSQADADADGYLTRGEVVSLVGYLVDQGYHLQMRS